MYKLITIGFVCLIIGMFFLGRSCSHFHEPPKRKALQNKISTLKAKVDTFKVHDTILVTKWRQSKSKTDTVYKWVIINAPDTCQTYIDTLVKIYDNERELANKTIGNKDSIITTQSEMIKVNEMLIAEEIAYSDSVVKSRSHKYLRGLRDGLVVGAGLGLIIPKIIR
jgi:hypothetical protein